MAERLLFLTVLPGRGCFLLRTVADGYALAPGTWPYWQWVKHELWREGLDAEKILRGLPAWKHGYRAVRAGSLGQLPEDGDPVRPRSRRAFSPHFQHRVGESVIGVLCLS
jgi:hypothetical protein